MGEATTPDMAQVSGEMTEPAVKPEKRDWREVVTTIVRSPYFIPIVLLAAGITVVFWPLLSTLVEMWTSDDGYYTHGFLVPLITGYLIYRAWPKIKDRPINPQWWAILFLIPVLWI